MPVLILQGDPQQPEIRKAMRECQEVPAIAPQGPMLVNIAIARRRSAVAPLRRIPVGAPSAPAVVQRVLDAALGVLWRSADQVAELTVRRFYAPEPYIEISYSEICTPEENHHSATTIARGRR